MRRSYCALLRDRSVSVPHQFYPRAKSRLEPASTKLVWDRLAIRLAASAYRSSLAL